MVGASFSVHSSSYHPLFAQQGAAGLVMVKKIYGGNSLHTSTCRSNTCRSTGLIIGLPILGGSRVAQTLAKYRFNLHVHYEEHE